jgi:hypothetical protein
MQDDETKSGPIEQPRRYPKTRAARAVARAALGAVPTAGAALAEAADAFLPNPEATDRFRWEGEITDGVNNLSGRVDDIDQRTEGQLVTFTGGAAVAARYMIEHCPDGLARDDVTLDDIQQAYPDVSRDELLTGLGDLESFGLIDSISGIGMEDFYNLSPYGYEVLDHPIMGWETMNDAREIAALAAQKPDYVLASELEASLGWPRRRLNPALRIVVGLINPGHVSEELQPYYVTSQFDPSNAELALLRRFAAGG